MQNIREKLITLNWFQHLAERPQTVWVDDELFFFVLAVDAQNCSDVVKKNQKKNRHETQGDVEEMNEQ